MLTVSHSGSGVFDTRTWQRVARDSNHAYPVDGDAVGIGPLAGQRLAVAEIDYDTSMMENAVVGPYVIWYAEGAVLVNSTGT